MSARGWGDVVELGVQLGDALGLSPKQRLDLAQLDGITPPPRRHRAPMPPLSEIIADLSRSA